MPTANVAGSGPRHTIKSEVYPLPVQPPSRRLEAIDLLRGLLMILMALDHTRDFFWSARVDPIDPQHSWPALYFTRWVTNLCAPGFIALAGGSVYLQRLRGKTSAQLGRLLLTRGLWLIFLEATIIDFGWLFHIPPPFLLQIIWTIGICMIVLAAVQWLPVVAVGFIGAIIIAGHNLLDRLDDTSFGNSPFWQLLHIQGPLILHGQFFAFELYPLLPWIGVICVGYAFGPLAAAAPKTRQQWSAVAGVLMLAVFSLLRLLHGYGDPYRSQHLATVEQSAMSFFRVQKYPPSLDYLLATFGFLLLLYVLFDVAVQRAWLPRLQAFFVVYGRVPFFYYVLHLYLIHGSALLLMLATRGVWRPITGLRFLQSHAAEMGWGFSLLTVYGIWIAVVLVLYPLCLWFSRLKTRRRDWWLSYL
jgi:uncharacterized membrane protein